MSASSREWIWIEHYIKQMNGKHMTMVFEGFLFLGFGVWKAVDGYWPAGRILGRRWPIQRFSGTPKVARQYQKITRQFHRFCCYYNAFIYPKRKIE